MSEAVTIVYCGETVSVPKEVADFLEQDRKREQAQEKQDARHLSKSEFETVLFGNAIGRAKNTVMRYVDALAEKGLISTEPTSILTKSGIKKERQSALYHQTDLRSHRNFSRATAIAA